MRQSRLTIFAPQQNTGGVSEPICLKSFSPVSPAERGVCDECDAERRGMTQMRGSRAGCDACLLRGAGMGVGDGCAAANYQNVLELSEAADRVWATMRRSSLAGGVRVPSAHWRAQGRAETRPQDPRCGRGRNNPRLLRRSHRVLDGLAEGNIQSLRGEVRLHLYCVRYRKDRRRDAGDSPAAVEIRARETEFAKRLSNSGRSRRFDWESGWSNERNYDSCSKHGVGKPAADVAVRLEKQAGIGWIAISSSATDGDEHQRSVRDIPGRLGEPLTEHNRC